MKSLVKAIVNMRRTPYQSLGAIILLSITLLVAYIFSASAYAADEILAFFERKPQVIAFFELDTPDSEIEALAEEMAAKPYTESVQVVSQEEALSFYQAENEDDPLLLELVSADILPASIEVSGDSLAALQQISQDLQQASGVDEVILQEDVISSLERWSATLRISGVIILGSLAFTSLVVISVVMGMKLRTQRKAIGIMRLLGAGSWFISAPFVVEGFLYGLLGSVLGYSLYLLALLYATPSIKAFVSPVPLFPIDPLLLAAQFGLGTLIAISLTSFAGLRSASRILKRHS